MPNSSAIKWACAIASPFADLGRICQLLSVLCELSVAVRYLEKVGLAWEIPGNE